MWHPMRRRRQAPEGCLAASIASFLVLLALPMAAASQGTSSLDPRVRIETTVGAFVIELDTVRAPLTAQNFLRYVRDGFYEGLLMHRVVPNFVVQGGGYEAGYAERKGRAPIPNESGNGLSNRRASVGMARGESPHSATAQFYVNVADNAGLNPLPSRWGYAVFGQVVEGMDVIDRISHVLTGQRGPFGSDAPLEAILITRATVVGEAAKLPAVAPPSPAPPPANDDGQDPEPAAEPQT
jgi:cyclophilin family peptidyl-prolyl cis-trans isomerase